MVMPHNFSETVYVSSLCLQSWVLSPVVMFLSAVGPASSSKAVLQVIAGKITRNVRLKFLFDKYV